MKKQECKKVTWSLQDGMLGVALNQFSSHLQEVMHLLLDTGEGGKKRRRESRREGGWTWLIVPVVILYNRT